MKIYFSILLFSIITIYARAGGDEYTPSGGSEFRHYREVDSIRLGHLFKGRGYCGILEMGLTEVLPHDSAGNMPMFAFNYVMGGHVTPWYSMGIGLGFNIYSANVFDLELTGDFRFQFGKRRRLMPFLSSPGGYLAHFHYLHFLDGTIPYRSVVREDGFVVTPSVGVRYAVNYRFAVTLALGYRFAGVFEEDTYDYSYHLVFSNGLTVRAGIDF